MNPYAIGPEELAELLTKSVVELNQVLDSETNQDRKEFIKWVIDAVQEDPKFGEAMKAIREASKYLDTPQMFKEKLLENLSKEEYENCVRDAYSEMTTNQSYYSTCGMVNYDKTVQILKTLVDELA